nr:zinc finger protein ZXDC-like isoform X1 [Lytechinus pictus]
MNGISADSKQGFDTDVLGFTGTGESPTLAGKSGGKNRGRRGKKSKEQPRISTISTISTGSIVKIQDGASCIGSSSISNLVPVQLGNVPDPPVLSIPDTAADNETISRLLGGQGAALLELGSSDCVNIDFIQDNVDYTEETGVGAMQSQSSTSPTTAEVCGTRDETQPEPSASSASVPIAIDIASGHGWSLAATAGADTPGSGRSPNMTESTVAKQSKGRAKKKKSTQSKLPTSALDLSMKHQKLSNISLLGNLGQELRMANSKKKAVQLAQDPRPAETSGSISSSLKQGKSSSSVEYPPIVPPDAEFTDPTGDSLLLNIAQVNKAVSGSGEGDMGEGDSDEQSQDAGDGAIAPQPPNPLMYIITSRDKTTGMTQRFRVTVDPESVMYIPVMDISDEATTGEQTTSDDVPLDFMSVDRAKSDAAEGAVVDTVPADVDNAIRDALLCNHNVTSIPTVIAKEDLGAITGDMITSALMLQGKPDVNADAESPKDDDDKMELESEDAVNEQTAEKTWTKKTPQRKKEAQETIKCDHPGCGKTIVGKSKYRIHKLGHNDDRPHKCPHENCGWTFPSPYKLRRHLSGHSGAKPFVCGMENCGRQFSTIYNLKMHLNSHFRQTVEVCDYEGCGKVFNSAPLLKIHKRKHFEEQRLKCEYPGCTKTFTTSSALGSHQRVHVKDATDYPCPFEGCTKVYDKACRLKLHMRSHTGERPFKCTFEGCDWAFTCIQKLTRHIVRHTGERKYRCKFEGCQKLFTRLEHLKSHEVFHSGQKPFACKEEGCNARFAARSSLYMHQKRHQQAKPMREKLLFSCPLDGCDMSFASKLGLKNHIVKGHGVPLPFTGGAGDFELIGLGNDQLHASTTPANSTAAAATTESTETAIASMSLPTIPTSLMNTSLLQSAMIPPSSASIPLSSLTSSRDEAASILASGLLNNQVFLPKNTALNLSTPSSANANKDTEIDSIPASSAPFLLSSFPVLTAQSGVHLLPSSMTTPVHSLIPTTLSSQPSPIILTSSSLTSVTSQAKSVAVSAPPTTTTTPKVYLENRSGSARTDYRAVTAKHPLPADAFERLKKTAEDLEAELLSQSDSSQSSDGSVQATFIPLNMMTSASLTLRDPTTGTRYIQTQLLQDDPPDMPDMGFPLSSHDSADQSSLDAALSVSDMLVEGASDPTSDTDFITSDGVIPGVMVSGFRESTINLQDLE